MTSLPFHGMMPASLERMILTSDHRTSVCRSGGEGGFQAKTEEEARDVPRLFGDVLIAPSAGMAEGVFYMDQEELSWKHGWRWLPSLYGKMPRYRPSMSCCTSMAAIWLAAWEYPYRSRGVNIISVAMDAPADVISALSGKIGKLPGITAKTVYAPEDALS